ncbi:MAG: Ig-like domain-containing protein [Bacteroidales bacterium]|nr:Ig-like domain-containing protein [Candidatus Scybalousia scybalohippi]
MDWYENYINGMRQTNNEFYEELAQAWTNDYFSDSTLVKKVLEEQFPFNNEYEEYEVHVDTVAEVTVNINKVIGDFISVIFKDCKHRNYRGQKYLYNGETYLCYDKINHLSKVAKTNLIRCNNEINWLDENGSIVTEKVFLGYDLTSTNDLIGKDGITSNKRRIIFVQSNDRTQKIKVNQRFMFQHNQCFRVEEIDNYNQESNADGEVTMIKLYLAYSPMQEVDNQELNICDYYTVDFKLFIDQDDISQKIDFEGDLTATVVNGNDIIDAEISWSTSDENIVTIDELTGHFVLVGNVGDVATIKASMTYNDTVFDERQITIVDSYISDKKIIVVHDDLNELNQMETLEFKCGVYIQGELQQDEVTCVPSGANPNCYSFEKTNDGYILTNNKISKQPLILTFSADGCSDVILEIKLLGLF